MIYSLNMSIDSLNINIDIYLDKCSKWTFWENSSILEEHMQNIYIYFFTALLSVFI